MLLLPEKDQRGGSFWWRVIYLFENETTIFEPSSRKLLHIIPEIQAFDAMNNSSINLPAAGMKTTKASKNPVRENRAVRTDTIKNSFVVFTKMLGKFTSQFQLCALTWLVEELQSSSSRRSISQVPPEPSAVV